jgi:hypothetical protein
MATTVAYTVRSITLPMTGGALDWTALSAHQACGTAGPDTFANTGNEFFYIKNVGAQMTVTFNSTAACSYSSDHDPVVTIAATTGEQMMGPFTVDRFGATVTVTLSRLTDVVCDVVKLPVA